MTVRDHHAIVVRPADGPLAAIVGQGHGAAQVPALPEPSPERGKHGRVKFLLGGKLELIHFAPHEPGRTRPCRIGCAEVPGLGPSTRRRGSHPSFRQRFR